MPSKDKAVLLACRSGVIDAMEWAAMLAMSTDCNYGVFC